MTTAVTLIALSTLALASTASAWPSHGSGTPGLWRAYPAFGGDLPTVVVDAPGPAEGEPALSLRNTNSGFAALAYLPQRRLRSFELSAWIQCESGPAIQRRDLRGFAFYVDPAERSFMRVACDYRDGQPTITLARVVRASNHFPEMLARWRMPPPTRPGDSWRHLVICADGTHARVSIDAVYLGEARVLGGGTTQGYIGVYVNHPERRGEAEVRFSGLQVQGTCPPLV